MRPVEQLIEALQIFAKYVGDQHFTHCEHDVLMACVEPVKVSEEDRARLAELGFSPNEETVEDSDHFYSYRFGSC